MGYSLSVRFKTVAERDAMLAFLARQDWEALRATAPGGLHAELACGEDLAYAPKAARDRQLGFAGTMMPFYAWSVAAWMASKSSFRVNGDAVMFYDTEKMFVRQAVRGAKNPGTHTKVDEDGVIIPELPDGTLLSKMLNVLRRDRENLDRQHEWLVDLNTRWSAQLGTQALPARPRL